MPLNAEILTWARETAGLNLEEAAKAIGLGDARGVSGEDRLRAFEAGEGDPSKPLLRRMAKQYRRPILTFYLPKIPKESQTGHDFRTVHDHSPREDAFLATLLREIKARQSLVKDLLLDEEQGALGFVGSIGLGTDIDEAAALVADDIGFSREVFHGHNRGVNGAFNYLRQCVENAGIFVILASNLGSWQTTISVDVFRGFAIADGIAPFVVINDQDARTAWSFTLLHECVHVWLGEGGISGSPIEENEIERYCNRVAARILLNPATLEELPLDEGLGLEAKVELITDFAGNRNLGRSMVAYQCLQHGVITQKEFREIFQRFAAQWRARKNVEREKNRQQEGGPNYYLVRRHRLGERLVGVVRSALSDGAISPTRASRMLGVKPTSVYPLVFPPPPGGAR